MTTVLVVDTDPDWCKFCAHLGFDISTKVKPGYDLIILSSLSMDLAAEADAPVIIATTHQTTQEALVAFRNKAVRYIPKDLSPDRLRKLVDELNLKAEVK